MAVSRRDDSGGQPVGTSAASDKLRESPKRLEAALDRLVAACVRNGEARIRNPAVRVEVPGEGFAHEMARGQARADSSAPMTPSHQFHLASVTKTMTATLVLQLWEQGALGANGLDAALGELELFEPDVLDRLHVLNGTRYGPRITVRQLLSHSSGIKDAAIDDAGGVAADHGGAAPGSYVARMMREQDRHMACLHDPACDLSTLFTARRWIPWDPSCPSDPEAGILNWFLAGGTAAAPLSRPGAAYHYSDTGYVMLALLTEKLSGESYHAQLRKRVFDPLGMDRTYLAYATDPDPGPWTHEVSDFYQGSVPMVTSRFNLSCDWGGGGVVSTVRDLSAFLQALVRGNLFRERQTLEEMLRRQVLPGLTPPRIGVGLGIFAESTPFGTTLWGHSGAWGAKMVFEPESGAFLTGTMNQSMGLLDRWWIDILGALHSPR